jgi:PKD repeat protein
MARFGLACGCVGMLLFVACGPDAVVKPAVNVPPTANIGGPYSGIEGTPITFDASKSSDADGDSLTYAWDFGDGTKASGSSLGHSYRNNGTFTVRLTVNDSRGGSDTASATVSVANAPPVITKLTIPTTAVPLGTVATVQIAYSDPGLDDTLTARLSWGDQQTSIVVGGSASHTYAALGNHRRSHRHR